MPATAARIGFITQDYRSETAGPDSGVATKYGDKARDTKDPIPTYFEDEDDAAAMATERLNLLKPDRRRFRHTVVGDDTGGGLTFNTVTPVATVIDDERAANHAAAIVEIGIDTEKNQTLLTSWG